MGHNGKRLEVQLLDDPNASREGYRLLPRNLLPVRQAFVPPPGPPLDDGVLVRELRAAMAHTAVRDLVGPDSERQDAQARVDYARRYVDQGQVPPPSKCVDPMCPTPPHSMLAVMAEFAPCCSGDQVVGKIARWASTEMRAWVLAGLDRAARLRYAVLPLRGSGRRSSGAAW